jgi:hypothetical protein
LVRRQPDRAACGQHSEAGQQVQLRLHRTGILA